MATRLRVHEGMTLVECLVALVLASLVSAAVISVLATQNRLLQGLTATSSDAEALRATAAVLGEELRWSDPARDIQAIGGDSVVLRAFRGGGRVCAVMTDAITVEYQGARAPAPEKDSLLVLTGVGELAFAIRDVMGAACGPRPGIRLRVDGTASAGAYALVFESGSYFLRDRALRYRLGNEGRQPLTDERFAAGGHRLRVTHDSTAAAASLAWPGERAPMELRFPVGRTQ